MHAPGLFDLSDHLARLSATGDPLEALERHVDFEAFRTVLMEALCYGVRAKGGRPPYDPVTMFKVLVLASMHNLSDERMEFLIRDRLSWLRFLRFEIGEPTPDQKTIWLFREKLTQSGAFKSLFAAFEEQLCERGYKPTGGQIVDATNSSKSVWADTAYRSAKNEAWLKAQGYRSNIHRKKPRGKPMAKHIRRGNATRSSIRACVEHVFGYEKGPMAITIRSIGQARAAGRITMANLSYNFRRLIFHERRQPIA